MHIHLNTYTYIYIYLSVCICIYIACKCHVRMIYIYHIHINMNIQIYVYEWVYIHTYKHIYIYMYMYNVYVEPLYKLLRLHLCFFCLYNNFICMIHTQCIYDIHTSTCPYIHMCIHKFTFICTFILFCIRNMFIHVYLQLYGYTSI